LYIGEININMDSKWSLFGFFYLHSGLP
jgi:hypothetical protein